ncbi:hypothetical protein CRYUN_Cryun17cG0123100 [Craigia yunnanensis]
MGSMFAMRFVTLLFHYPQYLAMSYTPNPTILLRVLWKHYSSKTEWSWYEARLTAKRGKFIRKTKAKILCGLRKMTEVVSESSFKVFNIAVLVRSAFRQFVNLSQDENLKEPHLQGFSIDVFKAAAAVLPYHFAYKLVPYYGSCDQLLEVVARKVSITFLYVETFDTAAGGIVITAEQSQLVEFCSPMLKTDGDDEPAMNLLIHLLDKLELCSASRSLSSSMNTVFPRYSPLASNIPEAVLRLKEAGELKQMEENILSSSDCSRWTSDQTVTIPGIGPGPFTGLFIVSGGASASALLITVIRVLRRRWESSI